MLVAWPYAPIPTSTSPASAQSLSQNPSVVGLDGCDGRTDQGGSARRKGGGNLLPWPDSGRCGAYADALDEVEHSAPARTERHRLERRRHGLRCRHLRIFRCAMVAMVVADRSAASPTATRGDEHGIGDVVLLPRDQCPRRRHPAVCGRNSGPSTCGRRARDR